MAIFQLVDAHKNKYIDVLSNMYVTIDSTNDEEIYWVNALNNAVPAWFRHEVLEAAKQNYLSPYVILRAIAVTLSVITENNRKTVNSLYLSNTFETDLDFSGADRATPRISGEDDDTYRERIRRFWQPPDSSLLEIALNQKFSSYGVFRVFEVPYCYFALDNEADGGYLSNNAILLPTDEFSQLGRSDYHAIVVYVDLIQCLTADIVSQIQDTVNKYRAMGVCFFFYGYYRNGTCAALDM